MCRLNLLDHVARELVAKRHANTRTLGGAGHLHNNAQMARRLSGALLAATEEGQSLSSSASRYTLCTVKIPVRSAPHARKSAPSRGDALIFSIS